MKHGEVPGVGKPVARVVQGTMMLDRKKEPRWFEVLDAVLASGGNAFDAGHVYGNGVCERVLGRWMQARGNREQVVIIDKGAHHNEDRRRVTPFDIAADLHDSLARLQTDYIDLYLLHRDDPSVAVGPIVEVLNEHREAGRIRAFGGSNWSAARIEEANAYARGKGLTPFVASSPHFSLAEEVEAPWEGCTSITGPAHADERAWYAREGMAVFSWSSLARGWFSGRMTRDNVSEPANSLTKRCYGREDNWKRLERSEELAREKGLSVPQVALAYVLHQPFDAFPLVAAYAPEEFEANAAAVDVELSQAEVAWLDLRSDAR